MDPADDPAAARTRLTEMLVRTGDEDRVAFREVYRLTSAKLFGICLRICGERQAAEDVLHEVYLLVWRRAGSFEPGRASPISWLATIARNKAIDWRRAASVRRGAPMEAAEEVADSRPLASDVLLADEQLRRLYGCLDALEQRQRDAIRTAFFEGVTYTELAARIAVPIGTMKSTIRRGLISLRGCLDAA